jgi:hypothetical protein
MGFRLSRLRGGEVIAGAGAVVLLVAMFAAPWYGLGGTAQRTASALGVSASVDGFNGLPTLRWLILVTIAAAVALSYMQATRRAPALPVSLSVIVTSLGFLTVLGLIYRVLIDVPGPNSVIETKLGAYLGLVCAIVLTCGGFRSLREEDHPDAQRNAAIPTVELGHRR